MGSMRRFDRHVGEDLTDLVGFFSWNVQENKVYGDEVFAYLFGVEPQELQLGVPIEQAIRNIEDGDRQRVAKALHDTIVTGNPCHQSYGIRRPDGRRLVVTGKGLCFRDADGVPSIYAGTLTGTDAGMADNDPLEDHCQAALDLATKRDHALAARYLSSALNVLRQ